MNIFNLVHFRNIRGMTCKELSLKCGLPATTVYNIENHRVDPTVEKLEKIADALSISPSWLINSPVLLSVENVLDVLEQLYNYAGGFTVSPNKSITFKSPHNSFLLDMKNKRNDLTISHSISEEEYNEWRYKYTAYKSPGRDYNESDIVSKNIKKFAKKHRLSDYTMGVALGYDDVSAGDFGAQFRLGERPIKPKQIQNFIKTFELQYSVLTDDFSVKDETTFNHALLALDESHIAKFLLGDRGAIRFENEDINEIIMANPTPPFYR
jgi:transcriptional regulator with XRE-family HTH domain